MGRKLVLFLVMVVLLTSLLGEAFGIEKVQASGTIHIRADGSIDPPTANITSADNVTYTFIGNINESIVVERNNIVVEGAGYTLQGSGSGIGFNCSSINNVTIKHTLTKHLTFHLQRKKNWLQMQELILNVLPGNSDLMKQEMLVQ